MLHRCSRYDLRGREILKTQEKFYLADTALRYSVLGYNADSVAASLENIVYLELCRRRYTVQIGKTPDGEIDFVAVRQNEKLYVQVTQQINSINTEKREYERLLEIHDNYPKYVLIKMPLLCGIFFLPGGGQTGCNTFDRAAQEQGQVGCGLPEKPHGLCEES